MSNAAKLKTEELAKFIHGAIMASDTPLENFLDESMTGPRELADDILAWMAPAFEELSPAHITEAPANVQQRFTEALRGRKPIGRDFFITDGARDRGECGFTLSDLANAVQLWSFTAGPRVSIAAAAAAFTCEPALIVDAVRAHHWMFLESAGGALIDDPDREGAARDLAGDALPASIDDYAAVFIGHEGE